MFYISRAFFFGTNLFGILFLVMGSQPDSCLRLAERVGLAMAATGSNFVFSPLSIRAGLSLTAVGSKGETLEQMLSFLGSPTLAHLNSAAAQLLDSVSGEDGATDGPRLSFVNGVWVEQSLELKPAFQEVAASVYGAIAKSVDFENRVTLTDDCFAFTSFR